MRKLEVICDSDGVSVAAYHVPTDLWEDHLHFLQEAEAAQKRNRERKRNRNLRCSLLLLFGHFEGVVNEVLELIDEMGILKEVQNLLIELSNSLEPGKREFGKKKLRELKKLRKDLSPLCNKTLLIRFILVLNEVKLPKLHYKVSKDFRNLISHPPSKSPQKSLEKEVWTDSYLYNNLTVEKVSEVSQMIAEWLDAVCHEFEISRLYDTEKASKDLAVKLGVIRETREI
jgi:hypothetical protein